MSHTYTRSELHKLVWSEPLTNLSKKLGVSNVAIANACKRANIPRPPMGHWAKVKAGKEVRQLPLPARGPGISDEREIGGSGYYNYRRTPDEELAKSDPQPPVFEDDLSDVKSRAKKMIKKLMVPETLEKPHRLIRRLLDDDEARRKKVASAKHSFSWDDPIFDDPFEQRRLRVLSTLFTVAEQNGMKPSVSGKEARWLSIRVGDQHVSFTLDTTSQKPNQWGEISIRTKGDSSRMRLSMGRDHSSPEQGQLWEDRGRSLVEHRLKEILIEIILAGEFQYRNGCQRHYEWAVEQKSRAIEDLRKKKEEQERLERERIIELEQNRGDRLLAGASALKRATEIREYVEQVVQRCAAERGLAGKPELEVWTKWAREQADRIDPVSGGQFLLSINDQTIDVSVS